MIARKYLEIVSPYSDHPLLLSLFVIAAMFFVASIGVDLLTEAAIAAAHLMVYGFVATFLGAVGYGLLLLGKLIRRIQYEYGFLSSTEG